MELDIPYFRNGSQISMQALAGIKLLWHLIHKRLEVQNAKTTVKKIEYPFYHHNYVNYYINYDYTLQKLHPHGAIK